MNATATAKIVRYPDGVDEEVGFAERSPSARPPGWRPRRFVRSIAGALSTAWQALFGIAALIVGLSVLATIPGLQLLSLGYLLEVSGRVCRTGRLRSGFVGLFKAARLGSVLFCSWLLLWIPRLASSLYQDALSIDPGGKAAAFWKAAVILTTVWVVLHIAAATYRGGRLRYFLWPRPIRFLRRFFSPQGYAEARDAVWDFVSGLRLPHYLFLGWRGFAGGFVWLVVPISLLAAGRSAPVVGFLGGLLLAVVVMYLPFLQTRMAAENRLLAILEVHPIRQAYKRAPIAFALALLVTLAFALPLYLLKIELIPREAAWLPSLLFVMFIFPARLLCGWALARAKRRAERTSLEAPSDNGQPAEAVEPGAPGDVREPADTIRDRDSFAQGRPRHWLWRYAGRMVMLPAAGIYVLIVYFTQYLSWYGVWSLYEQHAFLLPVPFLGG